MPRKRDMDFEKQVRQATLDLHLQPEEGFILKVCNNSRIKMIIIQEKLNKYSGSAT